MTQTTRLTLLMQIVIVACLAAIMVSKAPASVVVNVNGQTITVAAPETRTGSHSASARQ